MRFHQQPMIIIMITALLLIAALAGVDAAAALNGHFSQLEPLGVLKTASSSSFSAGDSVIGRIVGGEVVNTAKPWMVSIRMARRGKYYHVCGGTLISSTFVLTAAHCVEDVISKPSMLQTWVGGVEMAEPKEFKIATVSKVFVPPERTGSDLAYDIALLQLYAQIENVPVALPSANDSLAAGDVGTVYGWGVTTITAPGNEKTRPVVLSSRLQAVSLEVETDQDCEFIYPAVNSTQAFCAHSNTSAKDACQGDSGGPFMIANDVQFGIVSAGSGCGLANYPGVYTRVVQHMAWIEQTLSENKDLLTKMLSSGDRTSADWHPPTKYWVVLSCALIALTTVLIATIAFVSRHNRRITSNASSVDADTPQPSIDSTRGVQCYQV